MAKATKTLDERGQVTRPTLGLFFSWLRRTKKRNYKTQSDAAIPELKVLNYGDQALVTRENSWEIYA